MNPKLIAILKQKLDEYRALTDGASKNLASDADRLKDVCNEVDKSWSGSVLGHHAHYYYEGFAAPPPNRRWDKTMGTINGVPVGWEYKQPEDMQTELRTRLGSDFDYDEHIKLGDGVEEALRDFQSAISVELEAFGIGEGYEAESAIANEIKTFAIRKQGEYAADYLNRYTGTHVSRDMRALTEPRTYPAHIVYTAVAHGDGDLLEARQSFIKLVERLIRQAERKMQVRNEISTSVYLDTNIFGRAIDGNIKAENAAALSRITKRKEVLFFTSEKTRKEVAKHPKQPVQDYLNFIINFLDVIPEENFVEYYSGAIGSAPIGTTPLGGGGSSEDPIYTELKAIFSADDAEQIFQAIKSNATYFLTLDEKTILSRREEYRKLGYKTKLVSPENLERILFAEEDNT